MTMIAEPLTERQSNALSAILAALADPRTEMQLSDVFFNAGDADYDEDDLAAILLPILQEYFNSVGAKEGLGDTVSVIQRYECSGALVFRLTLDLLDDNGAEFTGPNKAAATIDRAAWNAQGRPTTVTVVVPNAQDPS